MWLNTSLIVSAPCAHKLHGVAHDKIHHEGTKPWGMIPGNLPSWGQQCCLILVLNVTEPTCLYIFSTVSLIHLVFFLLFSFISCLIRTQVKKRGYYLLFIGPLQNLQTHILILYFLPSSRSIYQWPFKEFYLYVQLVHKIHAQKNLNY